jgi:hypothetical protein
MSTAATAQRIALVACFVTLEAIGAALLEAVFTAFVVGLRTRVGR